MMSALVILIIGSIIAIISTIISFLEKSKDNKSNGKSNSYNRYTFLAILTGIAIAFYSGYISVYDKIESDSLARKAQEELKIKSDMIIHIQEESKRETKSLNDSLSTAKSKIINLQTEINNNIIGGLEPCYIV
ncbi:MAG: hypothetical protein HY800_05370, partial [Ignavibacteriales bacterium]|nr:hypothetical protein [Ignavibacteriales bacterium]